ncbi:MAG: hypothetical protein QF416_02610 [Candidatus Marinimicrobia bacterium]|nr:hypothetical protein [Candidatus Neomarinimicrobiota bacterium]
MLRQECRGAFTGSAAEMVKLFDSGSFQPTAGGRCVIRVIRD